MTNRLKAAMTIGALCMLGPCCVGIQPFPPSAEASGSAGLDGMPGMPGSGSTPPTTGIGSGSFTVPPAASVEHATPKIGMESEVDSGMGGWSGPDMSVGTSGTSQSSGQSDFNSSLSGPGVASPSRGSTGVSGGSIGVGDK